MNDFGHTVFAKAVKNMAVKVLAVGDPSEWTDAEKNFPDARDMHFLGFDNINEAALALYQPHSIYSPVFARNFDCIELAILLQHLTFDGVYRAFGNNLPNPKLIEREVRMACPRLNFEIVQR